MGKAATKRVPGPLILCLSTVLVLPLTSFTQISSSSLLERRIDPDIQAKIDDFIENTYLPAAGVSGMGLAIVQNGGEVLYTTGYGMANIEKSIPDENSTQFLLGSTSKSFTSVVAIKILHEKFPHLGEAVLDTPIRKLIPEVNFTLIDRFRSEHTTFRDLLTHRLCLFDLPLMADPFNSTAEMVYRTRYNHQLCDMRHENIYSNQMVIIAAELIGILAGKSYEDAMQDLWNDLGMMDTQFVQKTDNFTEMPHRTLPYYIKDNQVYPFNTELIKRMKYFNAAGGIFTTPNDMVRYMQFQLSLGNVDGKQVLPKEVMEWIRKPSNIVPAFAYKSTSPSPVYNQFAYGLSLIISAYDGWEYIQHRGNYPPYHNLMSLYPGANLAVYSGTHMGFNKVPEVGLHGFIFETLKGNPNAKEKAIKLMEQMIAEEKAKEVEEQSQALYRNMARKAVKLQAAPIQTGKYGSGMAGELELSERFNEATNQTQYFIDYGVWYKGWLQQVDEETALFKVTWVTDVIQENYAMGMPDREHFVIFQGDDTLTLFGSIGLVSSFKLGVELDLLPVVPWDPDSC